MERSDEGLDRSGAELNDRGSLLDRRSLLRGGVGMAAIVAGTPVLAAWKSSGAISTAAAAAPKRDTLVVASIRPAVGFDSDNVAGADSISTWSTVYDTLADASTPPTLAAASRSQNEGFDPAPQLASRWESAQGGKVWRFTVRDGVKSALGNTLTAEDVVWSMQKHLAGQYIAAFFLGLSGVTKPQQIKAVNASTVEFRMAQAPASYFLELLSAPWVTIYDSTAVKPHVTAADPFGAKWLNGNAAGFAPYRIASVTPGGGSVTLEAVPGYWRPAKVPKILVRVVPESSARLQLLLRGEAQIAEGLDTQQLKQVAKSKNARVNDIATTGNLWLGMNNTVAPFDDPAVRRGITLAVPSREIIASVYAGKAQSWKSLLVPWFQGYTTKFWKWDTDPAAAKAALAHIAGTEITLDYPVTSTRNQQVAILVQAALNRAGLKVKINGMDVTVFDEKRLSGQLNFWVDDSDGGAIASSLFALQQLFTTKPVQPILHYSNPQIDAIATKLARTKAIKAQDQLIASAQKILVNDLPLVPIAFTGYEIAASRDVTGFRGHLVNIVTYKEVAFKG